MDFTEAEREKYGLNVDDILVCEGGEVGRTALWRGELESCYFQKAIHRLRPLNNQYGVLSDKRHLQVNIGVSILP